MEPWRAKAFPIIKDLVVDRSAFDRIQQAGGFVSVNTSGNTIDANTIPIPKNDADKAFEAAQRGAEADGKTLVVRDFAQACFLVVTILLPGHVGFPMHIVIG